jgi:hypothetical protein
MKCQANTTSGNACKKDAITGATVCNTHGGSAPQVKAMAAVRAEAMRWTLGDATDDPGEVLLRLVTQSRMRVDAYSSLIEQKVADGQKEHGEAFTLEKILIGDQMAVTMDGDAVKTSEYIRGIVQLESQERDRLAGFATKAIGAGLAERQVRLAERQGELLAELMRLVAADPVMGLTDSQRELMPGVIRRHLSLVAGVHSG